MHHVEVESHGRGDQRHLNEQDDQDAEPHRIEAHADNDGGNNGNGDHHQRQGFDKEPEDDVEQDCEHQGRVGPHAGTFQEAGQLTGDACGGKYKVQEVGGNDDQDDHAGGLHSAIQGFNNDADRQLSHESGNGDCAEHAQRCGFGGCCQPGVD